MKKNEEHLRDILGLLWRKRKNLIGTTVAAGILTALLTLLLTDYYRASTTFYAASFDMIKPEKMFGGSNTEMNYYGSDPEQDRLLSVAQSDALARHMIDSFDLYAHYDIDSTKPKAFYKVKKEFFSMYDIRKTELDALKLAVEDRKPVLAAQMANEARNKIDELAREAVRKSQQNMIGVFRKELREKSAEISGLADSLEHLREKYGIYDPGSQSEQLSTMVTRLESKLEREKASLSILKDSRVIPRDTIVKIQAQISGMEKQLNRLTDPESNSMINLSKFNKGRTAIEMVQLMYDRIKNQLSYDRIRYEQLKSAYNAEISTIHLIESASVPEVKSRPTRSLIVLGVMAATFFFVALLILIRERYRMMRDSGNQTTEPKEHSHA